MGLVSYASQLSTVGTFCFGQLFRFVRVHLPSAFPKCR